MNTTAICGPCAGDDHAHCDSTAWCHDIGFPSACDCWKEDHELDIREPEPCAAITWRGSRWGDNPEPDEFCENDAAPDSDYCEQHDDEDDR